MKRVSQVALDNGTPHITTFTTLDGLSLPARDIAVDNEGTAWIATDGGLFRIQSQSSHLKGIVQDEVDQPIDGADVIVHGTSVRTVTDADGHFALTNIPGGTYLL